MPHTQHADRSVDALLERARELAQLAAERTQAIEQQRRLPDDVITALKDSGLLRILQPAHWGGYEMDLGTFIRVATEIAKGDTSDAVEGLMLRCADEIMTVYSPERRIPTEQERMRYYAWRGYMVRQATRVVDRLFELSGGRALYLDHPLQRIWRDVQAASQHLGLQFEFAMEGYGRTLVGLPSGSLM